MTWAKLDDTFPANPKIVGLSDAAFRAHVTALCYANQHLTDGHIPDSATKILGIRARISQELVEKNLWKVTENGWEIHDFLDYNPPAERVRSDREQNRNRQNRFRRNAVTNAAPAAPVPSRPVPSPESVLNSGQLTDVAAAPLFEEIPERQEESPMGSELDQRSREVLASIRLKLGERVWYDDPSIEAEFRTFLGIHPPGTVEDAVLDCYRANERPYPGNVRKHLPTLATATPRRASEPFRIMDAKDLKALRLRQYEADKAAEERERVAALA